MSFGLSQFRHISNGAQFAGRRDPFTVKIPMSMVDLDDLPFVERIRSRVPNKVIARGILENWAQVTIVHPAHGRPISPVESPSHKNNERRSLHQPLDGPKPRAIFIKMVRLIENQKIASTLKLLSVEFLITLDRLIGGHV